MTANVKITLDRRENVLTIPRRAVRRELGRSFVLVPSGNGVAQRPVTTGSRDETNTEIVDGLREGEEVLLGDTATEKAITE
jgi:multidrug efflux pump subunit AcrA (membrane-fusion protein)